MAIAKTSIKPKELMIEWCTDKIYELFFTCYKYKHCIYFSKDLGGNPCQLKFKNGETLWEFEFPKL